MKRNDETPQKNPYPQEVPTGVTLQETNHMDMPSICENSYYITNRKKVDIWPYINYYNFLPEECNTGYSFAGPKNQNIRILTLRDLWASPQTLGGTKGQVFSTDQ